MKLRDYLEELALASSIDKDVANDETTYQMRVGNGVYLLFTYGPQGLYVEQWDMTARRNAMQVIYRG